MDAGAMVDLALQWRNVPRQRMCSQLVVRSTRLRNQNYIEPQSTANNPFVKEFYYEKSECLHKKIDRLGMGSNDSYVFYILKTLIINRKIPQCPGLKIVRSMKDSVFEYSKVPE